MELSVANIKNVEFIKADLLAPEFTEIGAFDTVTAIHLLEHIPETQLPLALSNLLKVTKKRLLIAVQAEMIVVKLKELGNGNYVRNSMILF